MLSYFSMNSESPAIILFFLLINSKLDKNLNFFWYFISHNLDGFTAFSPLKIRLGGTLQDKVIYDIGDPPQRCNSFIKNSSEMFGFTQGCLPMARWDELNGFFRKTK